MEEDISYILMRHPLGEQAARLAKSSGLDIGDPRTIVKIAQSFNGISGDPITVVLASEIISVIMEFENMIIAAESVIGPGSKPGSTDIYV